VDHREELVENVRAAVKNGEAATGRRSFLKGSMVAAAASMVPLEFLAKGGFPTASAANANTYGPLAATPDDVTGNLYLRLPAGFSYQSFGRVGTRMDDGRNTPGAHDGMGVCKVEDDLIYLVRNHELSSGNSFGGSNFGPTYDSRAAGGTTTMVFDALRERWVSSYASLAGTARNCAGGVTPWGTWLTCEESTSKYGKNHGYVFEVPVDGTATAQPLTGMGRFVHEAAAIVSDLTKPEYGYVYLTEDNGSGASCGFYRYRPHTPGNLADGGDFHILKIKGKSGTTNMANSNAKRWDVQWMSVSSPQNTGVFSRGRQRGGATFEKLEGAWYGKEEHAIWFVSSDTGARGLGRIYKLDIDTNVLHMVYESASAGSLEFPDNLTVLSNGDVLLCEDTRNRRPRVHMMNAAGTTIFPLVESNSTGTEFVGVTFHDKWLFLSSQTQGLTYAITGPWENGSL
jgi:uncharacterized protein